MSESDRTNLTPSLDDVPATFRELVDSYLADELSQGQLAELESQLSGNPTFRRFFVRYTQLHRDLHLEAHARRQADDVLAKIGLAGDSATGGADRSASQRDSDRRIRPVRWLAAVAVVALAIGAGWWMARGPQTDNIVQHPTEPASASRPATQPASDIAWLVNAQNCQWAGDTAPADMKAGTVLKIERGLAELKFRSGAVVLMEGPARLELLTDNSARLLRGRLTGKVLGPIKGFELFSPRGKVIDLGTEFGVAVTEGGETDVYVFQGSVQAVGVSDAKVLDLAKSQGARIDAGGTAVRHDGRPADLEAFVREIVPPPVIQPKTLRVNFGKAYEGTLSDAAGLGTGLTYRLPGTGAKLAENDPNLAVNSEAGHLELTTTRSDINGQQGLDTGEYLGVRLADLGFTGGEDFQVEVFIPNIPALQNVGQFGLYAGAKSDTVIRGGLISRGDEGYTLFLTNNDGGRDRDSHFLGLFAMGDDLRIRLKRTSGKYTLSVDNLTTGASSTLAIRHPAYLDPQNDLYVGLFGANTGSEIRRTLFIKEFAVTVWTKENRNGALNAAPLARAGRP